MKRIIPKINEDEINNIIEHTPTITEMDKQFYRESIRIRKELILDKAYLKIA